MSEKRLSEILENLNTKHSGAGIDSGETYEEWRCRVMNENVGNLNEQDGHNCDICKNKGVVYFIKKNPLTGWEEMTMRDCKCAAVRRTLRRAAKSGLGNILSDCRFDKFETSEEWQADLKSKAQAFCADDAAKWFYVGGQSGAGKSHICTAIAGHYIRAGADCLYMLWRDDAVKLKALVSNYEEYQRQINEFKNIPVLYIDDFLKTKNGEEPTAADIHVAFELLNFRLLDKEKVTIISSEFSIFRALEFDEATIGRIYKEAGKYIVTIDADVNKNYRLRG